MKKWILYTAIAVSALSIAGCGSKNSDNSKSTDKKEANTKDAKYFSDGSNDNIQNEKEVEIKIKNYGNIVIELSYEDAPKTVENFLHLVKDKFYNGLTFHRIMDGFMIQGGDPKGDGSGGSNKTIQGEFSNNGFDNPIKHKRGVISMARTAEPNSASSQFFIVQKDSDFLDGDYAAFGHVIKGMDVVDKICEEAKPIDGNGTIPKDEQPIIESITIIQK